MGKVTSCEWLLLCRLNRVHCRRYAWCFPYRVALRYHDAGLGFGRFGLCISEVTCDGERHLELGVG